MARPTFFRNRITGYSGSINADVSEDVEKGDIVIVTGTRKGKLIVSLADSQYRKKSTGLLFVATHKCAAGFGSTFATYMVFPLTGETKAGDPIFLRKKGKWGLNNTKTSKQVGIILEGDGENHALVAPQGSY